MSEAAAPDPAEVVAEGKVRQILAAGELRPSAELPQDLQHLPEKLQAQEIALKEAYAKQELALRQNYASGLLIILAFQVIVADIVFCVFAEVGKHWNLSDGVIQIWLAAVVVQVVGVVAVVTRHLFPLAETRNRATKQSADSVAGRFPSRRIRLS